MSDIGATRHLARERALEIAYEREIKGRALPEILGSLAIAPDPYCVALLNAMNEDSSWAESLIERHAQGWTLERMSMIDRLIMTLALCELKMDDAPPVAVVLNEAVELARTFSSDNAPSFVNGVLAACVTEVG